MCILCVVQKWSRRVATMLPWLVIPLIGLWALSQLLPPGFRFEITSPRLACVLVLLVTLFWYEVLMPQLSAWQARRSARLREKQRLEAMEMQKLRKTATRRCRNCLNPYLDQNPGGGRFMCSYCGHISKRPVLDIPGHSNSGIIGDLVVKGGKIWNGKVWSENGWICGQHWLENGNWIGASFSGKSSYWEKNGDDRCLAEKSYSGVVIFAYKLLAFFFLSIRWLWRNIFRASSREEDFLSGTAHKGLSKKGENGADFHESKWEKARRKAEEKRQARLERELLEEEERKQREEVARLVEERRRLRDEKMGTDTVQNKNTGADKDKENKREAERKRHERRKEKDRGSCKSSSDGEELERVTGRESERKCELDKKSEKERQEFQKTTTESIRPQSLETGYGLKNTTTNNLNKGTAGTRYFDSVKSSLLSSSRAYGASFFGKGAHAIPSVVSKPIKYSGSIEHGHALATRRDVQLNEHIAGKVNSKADNKSTDSISPSPVVLELQTQTAPKKSWQQLFTRPSTVPLTSSANIISRPNQKPRAEVGSSQISVQSSVSHPLDNPIHIGVSSPFTLSSFPNSTSVSYQMFPPVGESAPDFIPEEPELFGSPCYVPDPVSLLGPVSESLDDFPLDLGTGLLTDTVEMPHNLNNITTTAEINRLAPIESRLSRLRVAEEKHTISNQFRHTPKSQDHLTSPMDESGNALGTWQMWGTPPVSQDGLNLVGGPASWLLSLGQNNSCHEDIAHPPPNTIISQSAKNNHGFPGTFSPPKVHLGHGQNDVMRQNDVTHSFLSPGSNDSDPWLQKSVFQPLSGDGVNNFLPLNPKEDFSGKAMAYGSSSRSTTEHEMSSGNFWFEKEWAGHGSGEGVTGNSAQARPHIGGLFSNPDVESLWSFN